mmetsp:Transcript_27753/g.111145  ORF Transcript_27753/g.111145 Transcript_27753/m.111145 type:complete len:345 (+) Transcript_27753:94-1128(+)
MPATPTECWNSSILATNVGGVDNDDPGLPVVLRHRGRCEAPRGSVSDGACARAAVVVVVVENDPQGSRRQHEASTRQDDHRDARRRSATGRRRFCGSGQNRDDGGRGARGGGRGAGRRAPRAADADAARRHAAHAQRGGRRRAGRRRAGGSHVRAVFRRAAQPARDGGALGLGGRPGPVLPKLRQRDQRAVLAARVQHVHVSVHAAGVGVPRVVRGSLCRESAHRADRLRLARPRGLRARSARPRRTLRARRPPRTAQGAGDAARAPTGRRSARVGHVAHLGRRAGSCVRDGQGPALGARRAARRAPAQAPDDALRAARHPRRRRPLRVPAPRGGDGLGAARVE